MQEQKHILSKSTFIRGMQCEKSLYLYKNFIQLRDTPSAEQMAIFSRGSNVGVLAQQLFPNGIDASSGYKRDNLAAVANTQKLIESGAEIIYEASFQYDGVLVILDILVKKNNQWFAYEVKSSVKISQTYLLDASLQYYVITHSGIELADISLITINPDYVRKGPVDYSQLFAFSSVKNDALKNSAFVEERLQRLKQVAVSAEMPEVKIGEQCFSPYNCDFIGNCWKNVPVESVFEIGAVAKAHLFELYNNGVKTVNDIPEKNNFDKNANLHILSKKNNEVVVNKQAIAAFIEKLSYPLYFMDFESFMPAVPIYNNTKPYQHIPFQYSLHCIEQKGGVETHTYFLGEQGLDPRKAFIEKLITDVKDEGTILVYDALMERNILNALKKDFPEYTAAIDLILKRLVDLIQPFNERSYYHPKMKNLTSIKNVLPALVPELNFNELKISSGSIAMIAYEKLQKETDMFKIPEVREQLLEYCKMDTLAMVKVFQVLEKSIAP